MRQRKECKTCGFYVGISCLCDNQIKPDSGVRKNVFNGVTDDRLYTQKYDHGAGRKWNSYAERKAWMNSKGFACE